MTAVAAIGRARRQSDPGGREAAVAVSPRLAGWDDAGSSRMSLYFADVAQAAPRVLLQAPVEQPADWFGQIDGQRLPAHVFFDHAREGHRDVFALERTLARQHLVEDHAEGPDVGTPIDGLAACLLGCHVGGRPDDQARPRCPHGERRRVHRLRARGRSRIQCLRQPEVEHFHRAVGAHLDIRGFQIAMDDALVVRGFQGVCDLLRNRQRVVQRHGSARDQHRQVVAWDQLHDERAHAAELLEAVDVRDVGMVQRGEDLCFPLEAGKSIGVVGEGLGQHLDRDVAIELRIARAIDLPHAALADRRSDFVDAEARAGCQSQR